MMAENPKRILFIDDEPNILEMLSRVIAQCGENWIAQFSLGVEEALGLLAEEDFDTVLSDIRMPNKDGFFLLEAMQGDPKLRHIPVIMLTGEVDRTHKKKALDLGATDLLNKPVSREDLIARIRSAVRLKRYQDELEDQVSLLDRLVRERTEELELSHREVVWRLAKAGEYRDDHTGNHVARVAWCSSVLAEGLKQEPDFVELLFQVSPLHDIGKIGIPDAVLLKPGKLTPAEREVIERHCEIGAQILSQAPKSLQFEWDSELLVETQTRRAKPSEVLEMASAVARHHHEKWDGTGYPDKLAGDHIPVEARIVALADVYDALISWRPYKNPMHPEQVRDIIASEKGRHFDPQVVNAFFAGFDRIQMIQERAKEGQGSLAETGVEG